MTRVAAIDCGTNTIRLLIADARVAPGGAVRLVPLVRLNEIVRLGQGVDRTGRLDEAALERTLAVVGDYADRCRELGAQSVRFVATSATRDASNRAVFVEGVRELLGVEPEVVSGQEEARLSFAGSLLGAGLVLDSHHPGAVRNRPRGYPHSVPSFVPRPPHQPLPMVVHSPLWTTGLPDPGYPQGWAHPADPDQPAGYQPLPAPGACGKPAFPPLSQPVVRREHTGCGLPLPQRGRTSSSTAPLRRGTAPRHPAQEVVPTCGQLCGKTA